MTPTEPTSRLLGDLRIFQAIHNDLKLSHEEITRSDGSKAWAYVYDGVDPYELEDSAFPGTVAAIESLLVTREALARLDELSHVEPAAYTDIVHPMGIQFVSERLAQLKRQSGGK